MKTCFKCSRSLPATEFYRHPQMDNGRLGKCKECTKRDARGNREKRIDYYRAYDRARGSRQSSERARELYRANPEPRREAKRRWAAKNPLQRRATTAVGNALRDGKLHRAPCEVCGTSDNVQGHHDDYSRPLDVRWLCVTHHAEHHKQQRGLD